MKDNEKAVSYIKSGKISKIKSPHPAYIILKPYIRPVKGSRRPFLSFPDTKYHFNNKGALNE
jgi:hypothetical protein